MSPGPHGVIAVVSVLAVIGTLGVAARFLVRWMKKTKYGLDDWTVLFSMLIMWAITAVILRGAVMGYFGGHTAIDPKTGLSKPTKKDQMTVKYQHVVWLMTICGLAFVKISVLLLYRRIFQVQRRFNIYSIVLMVLIAFWGLAFLLATLFECGKRVTVPYSSAKLIKMYCVDTGKITVGSMISDVLSDLLVLLAPVPMVWKLHISKGERFGVIAIFSLGFLATAAGIARAEILISAVYGTNLGARDIASIDTEVVLWSLIEVAVATLAACLPTLRPLFIGKSPESLIGSIRSALSLSSRGSGGSRNATRRAAQDDSVALKTNAIELGSMRPSESRSGEGGERAYSEASNDRNQHSHGNTHGNTHGDNHV